MSIRVQVTLSSVSGIPEDLIVNTWTTRGGAGDPADDDSITQLFVDFYQSIQQYIGSTVSRAIDHRITLYDLADPEPRVPFYEKAWQFDEGTTGANLPREVALCTSFRGSLDSGTIPARRRGRVFIGPLTQSSSTTDGRPNTAFVAQLTVSTKTLCDELKDAYDGIRELGVYSRVTGQTTTVDAGWVDNEYDTQRRRGRRATSRDVWVAETI